MVEKLILNDKKTGKDFELHVSGVFVAVGQIPKNETFADTVKLDEGGFVLASEDCLTSHPGIFAAGLPYKRSKTAYDGGGRRRGGGACGM